jgi:hypothetical protein
MARFSAGIADASGQIVTSLILTLTEQLKNCGVTEGTTNAV